MSTGAKPNKNPHGNGGYEREDLSVAGVLYFLGAIIVLGLLAQFLLTGFYKVLDERINQEQPAVSPLATNVPKDTRKLPVGYTDYLKHNFPAPRLEIDERTELNADRIAEEEKLNSYGYVDDSHVTVHIPIERAMDLIEQRGLPVRSQSAAQGAEAQGTGSSTPAKPKAKTKAQSSKGGSQ